MDKLKPTYRFDQLQAWLVLSEYLKINPHLPRPEDRPQIVKDAIDALDSSINQGLEGEQAFDEHYNAIGEPEIVMTAAECQDEEWNAELADAMKELNDALPLWKQKTIRIKNYCRPAEALLRESYQYVDETKGDDKGYFGTFKVEEWMDGHDVRNAIAQLFCPPGYNFRSRSHTYHFGKDNDIVYTFSYSRNGTDNGQMAAGW